MTQLVLKPEALAKLVFLIRGEKIMLDTDLAMLYGVETGALNRAVKRNAERFPSDFMFQLGADEWENLRCQIGISSSHGGRRGAPYGFTEQGVAMLSSVLNSEQAILVNIQIIRVFTRMREMLLSHQEILQKLEQLEGRVTGHDEEIQAIFDHLTELVAPATQPRKPIGFNPSPQ